MFSGSGVVKLRHYLNEHMDDELLGDSGMIRNHNALGLNIEDAPTPTNDIEDEDDLEPLDDMI